MKVDHEDDILPEYELSGGVRGRYAGRLTPSERAGSERRAWVEMVNELSSYTLQQVEELETVLFTFFVLAGHQPVQNAARHAATLLDPEQDGKPAQVVQESRQTGLADPALLNQLQAIAGQRAWVEHPFPSSGDDRESLKPVLARLEAIYDEVRSLKARVALLVEQHLAGAGLSPQEIERRTEETAKLWLAA